MIDYIYYINLKSRKSKKLFMEHQLSNIGIPYSRFEAIRPTEESIKKRGDHYSFYKRNRFDKAKVCMGESYIPSNYQVNVLCLDDQVEDPLYNHNSFFDFLKCRYKRQLLQYHHTILFHDGEK